MNVVITRPWRAIAKGLEQVSGSAKGGREKSWNHSRRRCHWFCRLTIEPRRSQSRMQSVSDIARAKA